jgi:hypothetical protein
VASSDTQPARIWAEDETKRFKVRGYCCGIFVVDTNGGSEAPLLEFTSFEHAYDVADLLNAAAIQPLAPFMVDMLRTRTFRREIHPLPDGFLEFLGWRPVVVLLFTGLAWALDLPTALLKLFAHLWWRV